MSGVTRLPVGLILAYQRHQKEAHGRDLSADEIAKVLSSLGTVKSVEELADGLHERYYAGEERDAWDKRMGLTEWRETYPGAWSNVARGIGAGVSRLASGAVETASRIGAPAAGAAMAQHTMRPDAAQLAQEAAKPETAEQVQRLGQDAAKEIKGEDFGYDPEATTQWKDVKANWFNAVPFGLHHLVKSAPDMVVIAANAPSWVLAHAGTIAQERAEADGRKRATNKDLAIGLLTAAPVGALDKLALNKLFSTLGEGKHIRSLLEKFGFESLTEAVQEAGEAVGTLAATKAGQEMGAGGIAGEALSAGAQGAVVGAVGGAVIGGPSELSGKAPLQRKLQQARAAQEQQTEAVPEADAEAEIEAEAEVEPGDTHVDTMQMEEEAKLGKRQAIPIPGVEEEVPPELEVGRRVMVADPINGIRMGEVKKVTENFINIVKPGTNLTIQAIDRGRENRAKLFTEREADSAPSPDDAEFEEYRAEVTRLAGRVMKTPDDTNAINRFRKITNQPLFNQLSQEERDAIDDKLFELEQREKAAKEAEVKAKEAAKKKDKGKSKEKGKEKAEEPEVEVGEERKAGKLEGKPYFMSAFTPDQVDVSPSRFQYKKDAIGKGGTDNTFAYTEKWADVDAGEMVFWTDKEGKTWVVDGHQRFGFAQKRTRAGDKGIVLRGQVFKEADGWTAKEARLVGARRNIKQHHGTAWDAADVFREYPKELESGEYPNTAITKAGRDIAKLRENAAAELKNAFKNRPNIAGVIGRMVGDKPVATQLGVARSLIEEPPTNEREAEHHVYAWLADDVGKTTETESLFGTEKVGSSDFKRYAALTDALAMRLKAEGKFLKTAAEGRKTIEGAGAGNINRAIALQGASSSQEQVKLFQDMARTKGPVSQAIREGLKLWTDTKSRKQKAEAVELIRAALEREYTQLGGEVVGGKKKEGRKKPAPAPEKKKPAATTPAPKKPAEATTARLPADLRGAKPRYGYRGGNYTVAIESDIDRALYITAQKNPSKRDKDYRKFLEEQGYDDHRTEAGGQNIRARIKKQAKTLFDSGQMSGTLSIADHRKTEAKPATDDDTVEGLFGPQPAPKAEPEDDTGQDDLLAQVGETDSEKNRRATNQHAMRVARAVDDAEAALRTDPGFLPRDVQPPEDAVTRSRKVKERTRKAADKARAEADKAKAKAGSLREVDRQSVAEPIRLADEFADIVHQAANQAAKDHEVIKEMNAIAIGLLPGEIKTRVAQNLKRRVQGTYLPEARIIEVALNATNPLYTFSHETLHALRNTGLIRDGEWKDLLAKAKKDDWLGKFDIEKRYAKYYKDGKPDGRAYEEAVAEGVGSYVVGNIEFIKTLSKQQKSVFDRIREFFYRLARLLRQRGYTDVRAEMVFQRIASGAVARRTIDPAREERVRKAREAEGKGQAGMAQAPAPKKEQEKLDKVKAAIRKARKEGVTDYDAIFRAAAKAAGLNLPTKEENQSAYQRALRKKLNNMLTARVAEKKDLKKARESLNKDEQDTMQKWRDGDFMAQVAPIEETPSAEGFEFSNPELEEAMSEGEKGVNPVTIAEKVKAYVEAGPLGWWHRVSRHWRTLAEIRDNADVIEKLRQLEASGEVAVEDIYNHHQRVMEGLTKDEMKVVSRTIFLRNLLYRAEMKLEIPKPFTEENIKVELARLEGVIDAHEGKHSLRDRLEQRSQFQQEVAADMVRVGVLTEEQAANPHYIFNQVMEYAELKARAKAGAGTKIINPHWHRARGSGKPINFNYFEVESEWLFKALTEIQTKKYLNWLEESKYNVLPELRKRATAKNQEVVWAKLNKEIRAAPGGSAVELGTATTAPKLAAAFRKAARAEPELAKAYRAGKLPILQEFNNIERATREHIRLFREAYTGLTQDEAISLPTHIRRKLNAMADGKPQGWRDLTGRAPIIEVLEWAVNNPGYKTLAQEAGALLAANARREMWMKSTVGEGELIKTRNAASLMKAFPDDVKGLAKWQPDSFDGKTRAINFFTGRSINGHLTDSLMDQLQVELAKNPDGLIPSDAISSKDVLRVLKTSRDALMVGSPKKELVIDEGIAGAMNEFRDKQAEALIPTMTRGAVSWWKQYILINPRRIFKYVTNNLTGDIDALIGNELFFKVARRIPEAHKLLVEDAKSTTIPPGLRRAREKGVLHGGATQQEIRSMAAFQIDDFGELDIRKASKSVVTKAFKAYFHKARDLVAYRENVVRLSAYLYYRDALVDQGKSLKEIGYGSTPPYAREGLSSKDDLAARMARDVLGDYGFLGQTGRWTRRYTIPFWAWMETNAVRYGNRWRNVILEVRDEAGTASAIRKLGSSAAGIALRTAVATPTLIAAKYAMSFLFTGLVWTWNNLFFPEEEEAMSWEERMRLHLHLGVNDEGEVFSLRFQGALSDNLSWIGFENAGAILMDMQSGRAGMGDLLEHMGKATPNKLVNSVSPVYKLPGELFFTGKAWFPDVFEPRAIQDPWNHFFRTFSLNEELDLSKRVVGKPVPKRGSYLGSWREAVLYRADPGETIYNTVRGRVYDYKRNVLEEPAFSRKRGEFGELLYRLRKAKQFNDKAAIKYYREEIAAKGKEDGLTPEEIKAKERRGLIAMHPARALTGKKGIPFAKYWRTLSPKERQQFKRAVRWYHQTLLPASEYNPSDIEMLTIYKKNS